jgi:hypothetical protein
MNMVRPFLIRSVLCSPSDVRGERMADDVKIVWSVVRLHGQTVLLYILICFQGSVSRYE